MTTWGDLRAGDVILDKTDVPWTVVNREPIGLEPIARYTIRNEAGRSVPVVKPASEPVTLAPWSGAGIAADGADPNFNSGLDPETNGGVELQRVQDAFGEDKVELIASETTDETKARDYAKAWDKPLELPQIEHPATLRSHLYLVHDFYVADVDSTLALKEHHRKQHADFPDQGTPHTHTKEN